MVYVHVRVRVLCVFRFVQFKPWTDSYWDAMMVLGTSLGLRYHLVPHHNFSFNDFFTADIPLILSSLGKLGILKPGTWDPTIKPEFYYRT